MSAGHGARREDPERLIREALRAGERTDGSLEEVILRRIGGRTPAQMAAATRELRLYRRLSGAAAVLLLALAGAAFLLAQGEGTQGEAPALAGEDPMVVMFGGQDLEDWSSESAVLTAVLLGETIP